MPVKYQCPKCRRRFAEWGAEKLGFKCPQDELCPAGAADESIELVRMGTSDEKTSRKPAVRRLSRRAVAGVPVSDGGEDEFSDSTSEFSEPDTDDTEVEDDEEEDEEEVAEPAAEEPFVEEVETDDDSDSGDDVEEFDEADGEVVAGDDEDEEV